MFAVKQCELQDLRDVRRGQRIGCGHGRLCEAGAPSGGTDIRRRRARPASYSTRDCVSSASLRAETRAAKPGRVPSRLLQQFESFAERTRERLRAHRWGTRVHRPLLHHHFLGTFRMWKSTVRVSHYCINMYFGSVLLQLFIHHYFISLLNIRVIQ